MNINDVKAQEKTLILIHRFYFPSEHLPYIFLHREQRHDKGALLTHVLIKSNAIDLFCGGITRRKLWEIENASQVD